MCAKLWLRAARNELLMTDREPDWLKTLRLAIWGRWWSAIVLIIIAMLLIPFIARFY
jgi:hypothetical protein